MTLKDLAYSTQCTTVSASVDTSFFLYFTVKGMNFVHPGYILHYEKLCIN